MSSAFCFRSACIIVRSVTGNINHCETVNHMVIADSRYVNLLVVGIESFTHSYEYSERRTSHHSTNYLLFYLLHQMMTASNDELDVYHTT